MANHRPTLEKHTGWPPVKNARWLAKPSDQEVSKIREILGILRAKKQEGLMGALVVYDFVSRQIQPLKQRNSFGFEYLGSRDPSRSSSKELSDEIIGDRVTHLLKDAMLTAYPVRPYSVDHPPPAVSTSISEDC